MPIEESESRLTEEQLERLNLEREIVIELVDNGVHMKDAVDAIDKEIEAMGLEPMHFNPELRREDFI